MKLSKEYRKILHIGLIAVISVIVAIAVNFYFFGKWEKKLIQERKNICEYYANRIAAVVENNETIQQQLSELLIVNTISIAFTRESLCEPK